MVKTFAAISSFVMLAVTVAALKPGKTQPSALEPAQPFQAGAPVFHGPQFVQPMPNNIRQFITATVTAFPQNPAAVGDHLLMIGVPVDANGRIDPTGSPTCYTATGGIGSRVYYVLIELVPQSATADTHKGMWKIYWVVTAPGGGSAGVDWSPPGSPMTFGNSAGIVWSIQ